jgi:hypothetical protein
VLKLDDRSLLVAQGEWNVVPMVYVIGRFQRLWELDETKDVVDGETRYSPTYGDFIAVDTWSFGVEFRYYF